MVIKLTEQDQQDLIQNYPKLNCSLLRGVIWGTLDIDCSYDDKMQEIVNGNSSKHHISDSYEIRIDFNQFDTFGYPKVFEESGFIMAFAEKHKIKLEDLHVNENDDQSCCLGIFPEYRWQGTLPYIQDKVVPYFYWQSYRRIYGEAPWKGYSHGKKGIKEAMTLSPREASSGRSRNISCTCGSGRKYKKCCMRRDIILKKKL